MTLFQYRAVSGSGEVVEGELEAATRDAVIEHLHRQGHTPIRADAQIRYHHQPAPADIVPLPDHRVRIRFDKPQHAVTPGQAVVFYHDDEVIGGGWIRRSTE